MNQRIRHFEREVGDHMASLRLMLVSFSFLHRRLRSCHPEDFDEIHQQEHKAFLRLIRYLNQYEILPTRNPQQIQSLALEWYKKVALKEMPNLETELQRLIDQENYPRIERYIGQTPSIPPEEMADGFDFSWGLTATGP